MTTNDIRNYLAENQRLRNLSKVTIDNLRRIFSSFFAWLEDEDYIPKSPVRRIHKVSNVRSQPMDLRIRIASTGRSSIPREHS